MYLFVFESFESHIFACAKDMSAVIFEYLFEVVEPQEAKLITFVN